MSSADPQGLQAFPDAISEPDAWLEPFDWYREMREDAPVRYDPLRRSWDVFRYDDVKMVLDDETFSVNPRNGTGFVEPSGEGEGLILDTMLFQDPPRHDELRSIVDEAFQPRTIRDLEPRVRELATELLDEALADCDGELDLVETFAYPLPVIVIAELLGVQPRTAISSRSGRTRLSRPQAPTTAKTSRSASRNCNARWRGTFWN